MYEEKRCLLDDNDGRENDIVHPRLKIVTNVFCQHRGDRFVLLILIFG